MHVTKNFYSAELLSRCVKIFCSEQQQVRAVEENIRGKVGYVIYVWTNCGKMNS